MGELHRTRRPREASRIVGALLVLVRFCNGFGKSDRIEERTNLRKSRLEIILSIVAWHSVSI